MKINNLKLFKRFGLNLLILIIVASTFGQNKKIEKSDNPVVKAISNSEKKISRQNFRDTGIDETFAPKLENVGWTEIKKDFRNRVYVKGSNSLIEGKSAGDFFRIKEDGVVDANFKADPRFSILAFYSDGRILVSEFIRDGYKYNVCRLNEDGSRDETFKCLERVSDLQDAFIRADGKILLRASDSLIMLNDDGSKDVNFSSPSGRIFKVLFTDDDKVILSGQFEWKRANVTIAKDFAVMSRDFVVSPETRYKFDGTISQIVKTTNGKYLLAGSFANITNLYNAQEIRQRQGIVRLNADFTVDDDFNPQFQQTFQYFNPKIELERDGELFFSGVFNLTNGQTTRKMLKIQRNGNVDSGFNFQLRSSDFQSFEIDSNGGILLAGNFTDESNGRKENIVKLLPNGAQDLSFEQVLFNNQYIYPLSAVLQKDGKIITTGKFNKINNRLNLGIGRLNPNGSLDESFRADAVSTDNVKVTAADLQPDGKIVIAGSFSVVNGVYVNNSPFSNVPPVVRINKDGKLDETFQARLNYNDWGYPQFFDLVTEVKVQPDGKILVANKNQIIRLNADGSFDADFGWIGVGQNIPVNISNIEIYPNGKILACGSFSGAVDRSGQVFSTTNIVRINENGTIDNSFAALPFSTHPIYKTAITEDDKIYAALSNPYYWNFYGLFPRLNSNGTHDPDFFWSKLTNDGTSNVIDVIFEKNGNLIMSGRITSWLNNWKPINGIYRMDSEGNILDTFESPQSSGNKIYKTQDGNIIAFGYGWDEGKNNLVRYFNNGRLDESFRHKIIYNSDYFSDLVGVLVQTDGKVVVFGDLKSVNGIPKIGIVRLNAAN